MPFTTDGGSTNGPRSCPWRFVAVVVVRGPNAQQFHKSTVSRTPESTESDIVTFRVVLLKPNI